MLKKFLIVSFAGCLVFVALADFTYAGDRKKWIKAGVNTADWAESAVKVGRGDISEAPEYIKDSWNAGRSVGKATYDTPVGRKVGKAVGSNRHFRKFYNSKVGQRLLNDEE